MEGEGKIVIITKQQKNTHEMESSQRNTARSTLPANISATFTNRVDISSIHFIDPSPPWRKGVPGIIPLLSHISV